ncbi:MULTISPECIES: serine/threonine-protein kinase [Nostoc]|uniref:GUN4 domain-containing protein n=1 Tax=Nostoc paludosum FACHB-159 TaxID=2692908 RepID=A0ABR8K6I6_9NOSO|nr:MULTISPECIES: serine/threonine-protein kinase [Nostoc]MBD2676586.1 GUN4 domain-containing protein [Nostoc sp. FACHB-857]MBD2735065.1 GUN4 domain-containing protein [Nostoc paludosum FACHB-159]
MFWQDGQLIYNGKYKIEKYLGGGGFAVTYQAMHTKLNRRVVIKPPNISVQQDPDYPKYVERFKKEAQMLAMCCTDSHPHIVQVFDFFEADDRYCLEMQYIAGQSLWDYVRRQGALPETEAIKYIRQMGLALVDVHKKGVLHLDVTPPNIMLNFDPAIPNSGKAVLIDFGIAGDMSPPSTLSRSFGNKAFAPYELTRKGIRRPTVDVYCLAGSLYYAITGQRPTNSFDRKYEQEELVPPKQLVPSLSDGVNQAILQGMALEAKDRPQTMEEWLNLLSSSQANLTRVILASDVGVNYQNLENLLKAGKWKAADEETTRVMLKVAKREQEGWLNFQSIENFPCTDLRTIDQLWVKYSNGHFGFSVQKRIWLECGGKVDYETECLLGDRLGWRVKSSWLSKDKYNYSQNALAGHLPSAYAARLLSFLSYQWLLLLSRPDL